MRIFFVILVFVLFPFYLISQKSVFLNDITHINLNNDNPKFLTKTHLGFRSTKLHLTGDETCRYVDSYRYNERDTKDNTLIDSATFPLDSIDRIDIKKINKRYLCYFSTHKIAKLILFDESYFVLLHYSLKTYKNPKNKKDTTAFTLDESEFLTYYTVNFSNKKNIILTDEYFDGFITSINNKTVAKIDNHLFYQSNDSLKSTHFNTAAIIGNDALNNLQDYYKVVMHSRDNELYFPIKDSQNKFSLVDCFGNNKLSQHYDSIFYFRDSKLYIVCKRDNLYDLYNARLKKLTKRLIRAFEEVGNQIQMIENNKILFIDLLGIKTDSVTKQRIVYNECGMIEPNNLKLEVTNDSLAFYINSSFIKEFSKQGYYKILRSNNLKIEKIHFLDLSTEKFAGFQPFIKEDIIVMKNKKYGIYSLYLKNNNLTFTENYPIKYDTFYTKKNYDLPIKFKLENLFGYYPFNKDVRYKVLENYYYGFARFQLPNGKKGWLDRSGNEYIDE